MSDLLTVEGLARAYRSGDKVLSVLRGLDLSLSRGEMVAIVGESGVGKSTLLHLLGALDRPDAGTYLFEGRDVFAGGAEDLARFRNRQIGFVFQFHNLLPEFTALENTMMPGLIGRGAPDAIRAAARELLADLGVAEREEHLPAHLSGGEQQRVAIARALMTAKALLLADEPTGNLDPATAFKVFELMRKVQRSRGLAVVIATHNERLAALCDRTLLLRNGVVAPADSWSPTRQEMARP
ncbi:MAG TPA: ABC transporter ATP-binding protein [Candidatus Polarisedimenticolia bacterium]|nr:ABC transporter ATP-binding protein [Candidatus Polarisedimenticolia bacterium]